MSRKHWTAIVIGVIAVGFIVLLLTVNNDNPTDATDTSVGDSLVQSPKPEQRTYREISHPTTNIDPEKRNRVEGIILHHTAEPTAERSMEILTSKERGVGTHVVIDYDGTRYIMCEPEVVTFHAGRSILNGKEGCNDFTVGIEFQGNTLEEPLTDDQIRSGIEYVMRLMSQYDIPIENIVTHEMVRTAYKQKYPNKKVSGKIDITPEEYQRFMFALKKEIRQKSGD